MPTSPLLMDGIKIAGRNINNHRYAGDNTLMAESEEELISPTEKSPPADTGDARDMALIHGSGRSPGGGRGNPLQYSCLEYPMDRGAWWALYSL